MCSADRQLVVATEAIVATEEASPKETANSGHCGLCRCGQPGNLRRRNRLSANRCCPFEKQQQQLTHRTKYQIVLQKMVIDTENQAAN